MDSQPKESDSLPTRGSLLAAAIGAEPKAWQRLVSLYEPRMRRWCRVQGLDEIAASDVIQDAWMSVARGLASFRSEPGAGAFRAWLHQIVRRRIVDHRRRQGLAQPAVGGSSFALQLSELPFEGEPPGELPDSEAYPSHATRMFRLAAPGQETLSRDSATSESLLHQAMARVQREVESNTWQAFWRCVVDQRTTEEVAVSLAMTPANVRQCRSRVLRRLRQAMDRLR